MRKEREAVYGIVLRAFGQSSLYVRTDFAKVLFLCKIWFAFNLVILLSLHLIAMPGTSFSCGLWGANSSLFGLLQNLVLSRKTVSCLVLGDLALRRSLCISWHKAKQF